MQSFLSGREKFGNSTVEKSESAENFRSMSHIHESNNNDSNLTGELQTDLQDTDSSVQELPEEALHSEQNESRIEMSTDDGAYKVEVVSVEGNVDRIIINCPEGKKLVLSCEYDD